MNDLKKEITDSVLNFYKNNFGIISKAYKLFQDSNTRDFMNSAYEAVDKDDFEKKVSINSIVILTANNVETGTLHSWINKEKHQIIFTFKNNEITYYIFKWYDYTIVNVELGTLGSNTKHGSAITIREIIKDFTPKLILSFGVAFGINHKAQNLGDVLVSKSVWAYDKGVKVKPNSWELKYKQSYDIDSWLNNCFCQRRDFLSTKNVQYSIKYGNILTGEMVVDNQEFKEAIINAVGEEFIGGEMEGYGLFFECKQYDIPCAIIKGICDWGADKNALDDDPQKNEEIKNSLQAYAMQNVLTACDTLFEDKSLFSGRTHNYFKNLPITYLVENNKFIKFFYQHTNVCYFAINFILALVVIYSVLNHTYFSFSIAILTTILGTVILCFLIFIVLLYKNKKILQNILSVINTIMNDKNDGQ